ncbi:MAG: 1-acyl-sn-glycerol-3-phosphate acyltransferase [Tannerella sp.]|jgi:1-acyl-sn-glycerol-3-phosphate acyltransferase|nr:1-acyl-sn-glycerol-3-phosphate acyltransferase [Tannerella sp.]
MIRILFSFYFWLIVMPVFCVSTILTALIVMIGCLLGGEKLFAFYPGMYWSRLTCWLALCPVKVRGREHLRPKQSYVFVANHQGAFDIFMIYGFLGYPIKWMMKIGLAKIPFVGAACRAAGFIFVDHSSPRAALRSIAEAKLRLQGKASLVVFPEGSRTANGQMSRFHKGAFQVALEQGLPIVPITLNGPYKVLPVGSIRAHPHRMEMVIHPPIRTDEQAYAEKGGLQALADRTRGIIATALWEEFKG